MSPGQSQHQVYVSPHIVAVQLGLAQLLMSPQQYPIVGRSANANTARALLHFIMLFIVLSLSFFMFFIFKSLRLKFSFRHRDVDDIAPLADARDKVERLPMSRYSRIIFMIVSVVCGGGMFSASVRLHMIFSEKTKFNR